VLALLKTALFATLTFLTGLLLILHGPQHEPWQTMSGCVFGLGIVALIYCIRDAIQLGLQRFGRSSSSFTIQTHLGACLLLLLGLFIGHGDPRLEGTPRLMLAVGLPLAPYLYWGFWTVVGRIVDKVFSAGPKPTKRTRKH
jgi:hypothetical protein